MHFDIYRGSFLPGMKLKGIVVRTIFDIHKIPCSRYDANSKQERNRKFRRIERNLIFDVATDTSLRKFSIKAYTDKIIFRLNNPKSSRISRKAISELKFKRLDDYFSSLWLDSVRFSQRKRRPLWTVTAC